MPLPIEEWFEKQSVPADARSIFEEASLCFKSGAFRASLILSYLSFLLTVRSRLQSAPGIPAAVPPNKWTALLKGLADDSEWDPTAFDATQTMQPAAYFLVPQDYRKQVEYWRARRNDCAHGKANIITHAHVEAFWLFLRSTLQHWVVNGSAPALLQEFRNHFDPAITPPGTDFTPLVEKVSGSILPAELGQFLADLEGVLAPTGPFLPGTVFDRFFKIHSSKPTVTEAVARHISRLPETLVSFLTMHLDCIGFFGGDQARVRKLWYQDLHTQLWPKLPIFVALLRNELIPESERHEAAERLVSQYGTDIPSNGDIAYLEPTGFLQLLRARLASSIGDFHWANARAQLFVWLVATFPLDLALVKVISGHCGGTYHPYDVSAALNQFFATTPAKKAEFRGIADANHVSLPTNIPSLA